MLTDEDDAGKVNHYTNRLPSPSKITKVPKISSQYAKEDKVRVSEFGWVMEVE